MKIAGTMLIQLYYGVPLTPMALVKGASRFWPKQIYRNSESQTQQNH